MLDTILGKAEKEEAKQKEIAKASPNNSKRDQLVPIYMYCKNLWDKWLIHPVGEGKDYNTNPYTVKSFFKNFLFIDSFYRNIYNLLPVNCQKFMNIFDSLSTNDTRDSKSLYSFIGDLAKECNCLFVAVPDYINLGTVDNDGKMHRTGLENMSKIFRCIPHNEMRKIETDNKFIVIYTHEPSKTASDANGFTSDTINICDSEGNVTEEAKQLFGGISTPKDADGTTTPKELDNMTAGAYPVPSFAVAFSGHNNHIFKSVDVNMDNPIATEHSINVLSYIAQMGSGNGQSVAYQGQDVFPIFSNYAYQSTVTMMGNVQIQPLMYYQLMNIPMWKGAYMIFNVKHSITPGNMTTTFTGMKMSKNTIPFLDKWVYPVENVVPQPVAVASGTATGDMMSGGSVAFGDFTLPAYVTSWVAERRRKGVEGYFSNGHIIQSATAFAKAKEIANIIANNTPFGSFAITGLMGAFTTECSWTFDNKVINKEELAAQTGNNWAAGAGCGEGWFGLTGWNQKEIIIKALNPPGVPTTSQEYYNALLNDQSKTLSALGKDWWSKILYYFIKNLTGKHGALLGDPQYKNAPPQDEATRVKMLCSSYHFKAGFAIDNEWQATIDRSEAIRRSHNKMYNRSTSLNGFAHQVYHCIRFALYMKNGTVPTIEETDKLIGV